MTTFWHGVLPAITTPFLDDGSVDHVFLARHVDQMMRAGCTGIVPLGSLGETATLGLDEKRAILQTVIRAVDGRGAVVPGVAALATADAVGFAQMAQSLGCVACVTNHALMDAALIGRLHGSGLRALVYTVNDPSEAQRLLALGIDGLITDAVDRFVPTPAPAPAPDHPAG